MNSEGKNINKELYVFHMYIILPHYPGNKKMLPNSYTCSQFFLWPNSVIQVWIVISCQLILCYLTLGAKKILNNSSTLM